MQPVPPGLRQCVSCRRHDCRRRCFGRRHAESCQCPVPRNGPCLRCRFATCLVLCVCALHLLIPSNCAALSTVTRRSRCPGGVMADCWGGGGGGGRKGV